MHFAHSEEQRLICESARTFLAERATAEQVQVQRNIIAERALGLPKEPARRGSRARFAG